MSRFDVYLRGFDSRMEPPANRLARVFEIDPELAARICRGVPLVVKKDVGPEAAERYFAALRRIGADVEVRQRQANAPVGRDTSTPLPTPSTPPPPAAARFTAALPKANPRTYGGWRASAAPQSEPTPRSEFPPGSRPPGRPAGVAESGRVRAPAVRPSADETDLLIAVESDLPARYAEVVAGNAPSGIISSQGDDDPFREAAVASAYVSVPRAPRAPQDLGGHITPWGVETAGGSYRPPATGGLHASEQPFHAGSSLASSRPPRPAVSAPWGSSYSPPAESRRPPRPPFYMELAQAFTFPLQLRSLLAVPLLAGVVVLFLQYSSPAPLGLAAGVGTLGILLAYLSQVVRASAADDPRLPSVGESDLGSWFAGALRFCLAGLLSFGPAVGLWAFVPDVPPAWIGAALLGTSILPATLIFAAVDEGCLGPLNLGGALTMIGHLASPYTTLLIGLLVLALLTGVGDATVQLLAQAGESTTVPAELAYFLRGVVGLSGALVGARMLGLFVAHHDAELGL